MPNPPEILAEMLIKVTGDFISRMDINYILCINHMILTVDSALLWWWLKRHEPKFIIHLTRSYNIFFPSVAPVSIETPSFKAIRSFHWNNIYFIMHKLDGVP